MPGLRFIGTSFVEDLAFELTVKSRRVIQHPLYQKLFPEIKLRTDLNNKSLWSNTLGGDRYAVGMGGNIMGRHAHVTIIDDPLDPRGGRSEAKIKEASHYCTETLPSRKVDKEKAWTALVMQRISVDDPTALFLDRGNIEHICLPGEETEDIRPIELKENYKDGLFDPTRLTHSSMLEFRKNMGEYGYAGQILQRPVPLGGGMFLMDKITEHYSAPPHSDFQRVVRFWDRACFLPDTPVLTEKGEIPIKNVVVGDKVLTRNGWKPVYFSGPTKITKDLCSVVFSDGTWNTSTPDHKYLTSNRNWITIASIRDGDELISTQEQSEWEDLSIQKSKPLCSTEKDMPEPTGEGITTTTQETQKPENSIPKHYIELSGNTHTTKKYPVAIMYTTLTETGITTVQRTLNACLEGNITSGTSNSSAKFTPGIQQKFQRILEEHMRAYGRGGKYNGQKTRKNTDKKQLSGALPQGTHSKRSILTEFQGNASYVTANTCLRLRAVKLNIARNTARNSEHLLKKNDKTGNLPAKCAAWNLKDTVVKDIALTCVSKLAGAVVYDLSVKESPEFFVNGVLVHNCTDGGGDYTVGVKMGLHKDGSYWILDVVRGQWASDERERMIHSVAVNDGKLVRIGLEQEPGSSGIDSVKESIRRLSGFLVNAEKATGDKVTRADTFSVQVNIGNVKMVRGGWVSEYKYEVQHFPNGKHDDQVDATSGAFTMLINKKVRLGVLK